MGFSIFRYASTTARLHMCLLTSIRCRRDYSDSLYALSDTMEIASKSSLRRSSAKIEPDALLNDAECHRPEIPRTVLGDSNDSGSV